jgi:dual specificity tyrosine-phosphorylation-regulated kinase 2/3/4
MSTKVSSSKNSITRQPEQLHQTQSTFKQINTGSSSGTLSHEPGHSRTSHHRRNATISIETSQNATIHSSNKPSIVASASMPSYETKAVQPQHSNRDQKVENENSALSLKSANQKSDQSAKQEPITTSVAKSLKQEHSDLERLATENTATFDAKVAKPTVKLPFKSKEGADNPKVQQMLSMHERTEILEYEDIWYLAKDKYQPTKLERLVNNGYDDSEGYYRIVAGDQIAYRFELFELIGKGAFG